MAIRLVYNDIALGAAEDGTVTTSGAETFSVLQKVLAGTTPGDVATCELNGWGLIHDCQVRGTQDIAYWSTARSGQNCDFSAFPTLTIQFTQQFTTTGLSINFSENDYCRKFSVSWYRGTTLKDEELYEPTEAKFVLNNLVESFDKIVFEFQKTNLPDKRIKVDEIVIGVRRMFDEDELRSVQIVEEVNLICDTLPVNVIDAEFTSKEAVDYIFQNKQQIKAYCDADLLGTYYVNAGTRYSGNHYALEGQDAIGVLDLEAYAGGLWLTDTAITTILEAVCGDTFSFEIDAAYASSTLRGFIPEMSKREALQEIGFALGAIIDTSNSEKIRIYPPPTGAGAEITTVNTYEGGKVNLGDTVTEVTVTAYIISDTRPSSGDTYIEYNGVQYKYYTDTKHAYNPNTIAGDLPNKIKFDKSYLVNLSNAQTLANNIMAYYVRKNTYGMKFVMDGEEAGDRVGVTLPWGTTTNGNITKMTITATGLVVADSEIVLD